MLPFEDPYLVMHRRPTVNLSLALLVRGLPESYDVSVNLGCFQLNKVPTRSLGELSRFLEHYDEDWLQLPTRTGAASL